MVEVVPPSTPNITPPSSSPPVKLSSASDPIDDDDDDDEIKWSEYLCVCFSLFCCVFISLVRY